MKRDGNNILLNDGENPTGGGRAWGLKHGQHPAHDPDQHPPLSNLLLSVVQRMGVETGSFSDSTGSLSALVG